MNIHTETALRFQPMLAVNAMENGGMIFTDDGDYLDAADQPLDPNRIWLDFENGDGARGHIPSTDLSDETDDESDTILDMEREDELAILVAEQAEDDANTRWIDTDPDEEDDSKEKDIVVHEGAYNRERIMRETVNSRGRRRATLRTASTAASNHLVA